nr:unnamed protein product [Callosobruchus analis]
MTRKLFVVDVLQLPEEVQEEFLETKANSSMKGVFSLLILEQFKIKGVPINSKLASLALQVLIPFSSTYLCDPGFSVSALIKIKRRNRLDVDSDLMISLKTEPRISQLLLNNESQVSR